MTLEKAKEFLKYAPQAEIASDSYKTRQPTAKGYREKQTPGNNNKKH